MPNWIIAVIFYSLISCWIFGFINRFRSNLTSTITMISPMVSGMITGMGGGTITGILLEQNLLLSLFISVLIGIIAGGIIGAIISIGAFLNGALSGMMAGMMGVMLMNMLPSSQGGKGIFAFMVIGGILQFVHILMLQGQIQEPILHQSSWMYRSPAFMMFVMFTLLFIFTFGRYEATSTDSNSIQKFKQTEQTPMSVPNERHMAH